MDHEMIITSRRAICSCGEFEVDLRNDENPRGKIEEHGRENDFQILVHSL